MKRAGLDIISPAPFLLKEDIGAIRFVDIVDRNGEEQENDAYWIHKGALGMTRNEARELIVNHPERYLELDRQSQHGNRKQPSYVCPVCGSGTGKKGTGITTRDGVHFTCWVGCYTNSDVIDIIGLENGLTKYNAKFERACAEYCIDYNSLEPDLGFGRASARGHEKPVQSPPGYGGADNMPYYRECNSRLSETGYHHVRGISDNTASRFMLGYDDHYRTYDKELGGWTEWQAFIIPTGCDSYVARNTDPKATGGNRYRKKGSATPLNWKALLEAQKPIFVVEGEMDALSIMEVGGEAIGLGSVANIDLFISNYVKKMKPTQPLVIAMDNDERGRQATERLEKALTELGMIHYIYNPAEEHKDANEALQADREAFRQNVAYAEMMEAEALEAERDAYMKTSAYSHLQEFINGIAESVNTVATPTGFCRLDDALDGGLYEGLYIIGAITSLGKTTLALQMADQIAESGRDVLIFSLEMARSELMSKSISRLTILDVLENGGDVGDAKTSRGITAGSRWAHYSQTEKDLIQRAMVSYGEYADHIYIHEGMGDIGVGHIRDAVGKHRAITGQSPVVLVDYVQILAPYDIRATDKQNVDKSVLELKRISRDYKVPVIGISSFNRASYKEEVVFEAFKESGSIEYGSDVLIGLQLKGAGSKEFDSMEAKRRNPREIELVILKNRNGRAGDKIELEYYPIFNYFKEM